MYNELQINDPELYKAVHDEVLRQQHNLELIASENYTSKAVLEALGSVLTNKYAEGYPGKRYYGGCENVDVVENLAIERAKKLFGAEHANVQPHSGTTANISAYLSLIKPGDKVMGLNLDHGGHLSHGHPLNFSGKYFHIVHMNVNRDTELIDYDEMEKLIAKERPNLVMAGASNYSRQWDWARIKKICDVWKCFLITDIAHYAGLVKRRGVQRALVRRHVADLPRIVHRKAGEYDDARKRQEPVQARGFHEQVDDASYDQPPKRHAAHRADRREIPLGERSPQGEAAEHAGRDEERRGDGALRVDHEDAGEGHAVEDAIQDKKECGRREGEAVDGRAENHDQHYFCDEESPYDAHVAKDKCHQGGIVHDEHGR